MDLLLPAPQRALAKKQVHAVGADSTAGRVFRPPDTVCVIGLIHKHLAVQIPQLLRGVHIEQKDPARHEKQMNALERPAQVRRARDIVDAVQTTDAGVDGPVKIQLLHGLVEEDGLLTLDGPSLFRRHGQHLLRLVHADHLIAPLRQPAGQASGPAGQVQHRVDRKPGPSKVLFGIIRPYLIMHIGGQCVIPPRQRFVAAHSSCSYFFRMSLARGNTFL